MLEFCFGFATLAATCFTYMHTYYRRWLIFRKITNKKHCHLTVVKFLKWPSCADNKHLVVVFCVNPLLEPFLYILLYLHKKMYIFFCAETVRQDLEQLLTFDTSVY